jgi:hypothetical protein
MWKISRNMQLKVKLLAQVYTRYEFILSNIKYYNNLLLLRY